MLHLHNASNVIELGQLGRTKIQDHVNLRRLNYWTRLVNDSNNKISFTVYSILKILYDEGMYRSKVAR